MREDLANKLYRRLKELFNQLPKVQRYYGYIKYDVGNNITEILNFICNLEVKLDYLNKENIIQKIDDLLLLLPHNSAGKISGYMSHHAGNEIENFLNELIDAEITTSISIEEKLKIDEIAQRAYFLPNIFAIGSPKKKISEFCYSIEKVGYDKSLLGEIVNINLQNLEGITSLTQAVQKKNKDLIDHLVSECGADIDSRNIDYTTPLHYAIASEKVNMVKFLLERGADPQSYAVEPEKTNTPLIFALECGNRTIIKILLRKILENQEESFEHNFLRDLADEFNQLNLFEKVSNDLNMK